MNHLNATGEFSQHNNVQTEKQIFSQFWDLLKLQLTMSLNQCFDDSRLILNYGKFNK